MEEELSIHSGSELINVDAPDVTADQTHGAPISSAADAETSGKEGTPIENGGAAPDTAPEKKEKKGFSAWWAKHKPSKRRLIQIYAALLYNANVKGFITGDIFTGVTKGACVPGLNCYSCPGAVGACPLGSLQNALAGSKTRVPFLMLGIILLYGLIFARTICGFLCPVGLAQDLLYKIKTPKVKKGKVTRILSYLKYVLLVVLVVAIPLIYALTQTAVPGFCKYVCPAGTFGGAVLLLIHPSNDWMFNMLGGLFTWKMLILIIVIVASIFIYRFFCRFLCPLGALYGLFNKISLLGIKVDTSKCTNCGKCIKKCKMDVRTVGDHECINCGECISVCPTQAIGWKGGKLFLNNVDEKSLRVAPITEKPLAVSPSGTVTIGAMSHGAADAPQGTARSENILPEQVEPEIQPSEKDDNGVTAQPAQTVPVGRSADRKPLIFKIVAVTLAVLLYAGVFVYANFFSPSSAETDVTYELCVGFYGTKTGLLSFRIGDSDEYIIPDDGSDGTAENPFVIHSVAGRYDVPINKAGDHVYYRYSTSSAQEYGITLLGDVDENDVDIRVAYVKAGKSYALYNYRNDKENPISFDLQQPAGYGNAVGDMCYDFTLSDHNGVEEVTLSEHRGNVVVINFWATWCGPCVKELPGFEAVGQEFDNVDVIAIHSAFLTEDVQAYIDTAGWSDWGTLFVLDSGTGKDSKIYTLLGGRNGAYPRTLVLDAEGIIRYVFDGSLSEERLRAAVNNILS